MSWNFAYDFVLLHYRSSLSDVSLRQFLWELSPLWNLEYWKYTVFPFFSYMLLHIELKVCIWLCVNVLQIKFVWWSFVSFVGVMPLLALRILEIQFSALFSYMLWHIELKFYIHVWLCFTVLQIKRKRRRSDPVLWQNPLYQQKIRKPKDNTQTPPKTSITQRLRTDLGRSVGVTSNPTGVVKPVYGIPTFPLTAKAV